MAFRRSARGLWFCLPLFLVALSCHAQAPVGDVYSADATVKGAVALSVAGTRLMSGSSVKAGQSNASVRLIRGGELRVCQGSGVSLTTSANGSQMMVGLSTGTIEAHFPLANSRDSVMTPDFEIKLNGPAVFHLAISADEIGNTCVQSLHGNSGSVTISELMGDGSYTVMPGDQLIFRAGHANNPGPVVASCGCPPDIAVERAAVEPPKPVVAPAPVATPVPPVAALIESSPKSASVTAPPPALQPGSVHVQVEAPFVFRASEPLPPRDAPVDLAEIRLSTLPVLDSVYVQAALRPQDVAPDASSQGMPRAPKRKRHGLWGFLASIFKG